MLGRYVLVGLALVIACGDDDRSDRAGDMGAVADLVLDDTPPEVVATDPANGAEGVMPGPIAIDFSEPMALGGTFVVRVDGTDLRSTPEWSTSRDRLVLTADLPVDASVLVILSGFRDAAGNPLDLFELRFATADVTAPFVVSAEPTEDAVDVDPELGVIRLELSETLATTRGDVALVGGPGSVDRWFLEERALVVEVSGLAPATPYELLPAGFADGAGNALDPMRYLRDGALDFTTGADTTSPTVVASNPAEGQVDVTVGLASLTLTFSEPMDPATGRGLLVGGGDLRSMEPTWREGGTVARFVLDDLLEVDAAYELRLTGFRDVGANPLDPEPYLGDGTLNFLTGDDLFAPYVVGTSPLEGAVDVPFDTDVVQVAFSEVMDTSLVSTTITSARGAFSVTGRWLASSTSIAFDVSEVLVAGQSYELDLSGFVDAHGTPVDVAHPYLGDGLLQFTTVAARGERCRDELAVDDATEVSPGVFRWTLADDAMSTIDGTMSCDAETSPDAVIRVTKQSDASVLRVMVDADDEVALQILEGLCDSRAPGADAARRRCIDDSIRVGAHVSGPAGDYYVWVAQVFGSFDPTTVTVEELPTAPEGESCGAPLTTAATRYYAPPVDGSGFHVWTVPTGGVDGYDRGVQEDDAADFPCAEGTSRDRGADAVVRVDKTTATSIVELQVEAEGTTYEILDGACDPLDPGATSLSCYAAPSFSSGPEIETRFVLGPARSLYVWAAGNDEGVFDGTVTVRAREVEPGPGESCPTALPLAEGANTVSPSSAERLDAPACIAGPVTWYGFTATTSLAIVTAEGSVGIFDAAAQSDVSCATDATDGLAGFLVPGRTYCVAVTSGPAVASLDLRSIDYPGVTGTTVTDLGVTPFPTSSVFDDPFDPEDWLVVTPTHLYLASDRDRLIRASRSGGVEAMQLFEDSSVMGNAGVAVGEAVFGVDDSRSAATRLYRYVDPTGVPSVTPWDTGSTWVAAGIDALAHDGTSLLMASSKEFSAPPPITFYAADPAVPGPVTVLGHNAMLDDVSALAADLDWLYLVGTVGGVEGVYRLRRSELANPAAPVEALPVGGAVLDHSNDNAGLQLQPASSPGGHAVLYFRTYGDSAVYAILDPGDPAPRFLGIVSSLGRDNDDYVLALDPAVPALFITEEETERGKPRFVRIE